MVTSCGVAARALNALAMAGIEVLLITTSDLDISLLVHAENEDAAYETLKRRMSFESAEAVTAAAVGIAAAILAWNRWITADSMLFGLLLAGLIGLAVAGVVFLVCKVFSYYRKNGTLKHRSFPFLFGRWNSHCFSAGGKASSAGWNRGSGIFGGGSGQRLCH